MNKRGQFYIVASILIILTLSALLSVKTYVVVRPPVRQIKDISLELKEEGPRIIEYELYNSQNKLEDFLEKNFSIYFLKKTENTSVVFVYGNKSDLKALQYLSNITGTISAVIGESNINWQQKDFYVNKTSFDIVGDVINVNVSNLEFEIPIPDSEKQKLFYFIIVKKREKEGEKYVEKNW